MASYMVMEPAAATQDAAIDGALLIRDGFSFPAFALSALWLLWHRLWIEAALVFAASLVIVEVAEKAGLGLTGTALSLLLSLFVGLEGQRLRASALRRRGWLEWGAVDAGSKLDAEARYADCVARPGQPPAVVEQPISQIVSASARATAGPALGMLAYPGRT